MIGEFPARPLYRRAIALTFNLVGPNLGLVVSHPAWTYSNGKQIGRVSLSRAWLLTGRLRAGLSPSRSRQAEAVRLFPPWIFPFPFRFDAAARIRAPDAFPH